MLFNLLKYHKDFRFDHTFLFQYATIDKASADKFKKEVMFPKKMMTMMEYGLIALGGLFLIIALILGARHQRKKNQQSVYTEVRFSTVHLLIML